MQHVDPTSLNGPATDPAGRAPHRGALASLSLAMLLSSLGTSIANVALPTLAAALDVSFQATQWIVLAYLLAVTTLVVGVGRLGDLIGRRRLLLAGLALFTAAALLGGLAPNFGVLVAARAAQGIGAAAMMALALALVGDAVPPARTGSAMGLIGTMSAIGTALGPSLGGLLIASLGWRGIFLVNLPLGVLALALTWRFIPADRATEQPDRRSFDGTGVLLLGTTLAAYALAMTHAGAATAWLLAAAAFGGALFVIVERRAASPLIQPTLFRDGPLRAGLAATVLVATVIMATLVVGPFYLTLALGLDAAGTGLVMSVGPAVAALAGVPAGRLVDRSGAPRTIVAGLAGMAAGSMMLAALPAGIGGYVAALIVLTASYALFQAANNAGIIGRVVAGQRGAASGLLNLARNLGLVTGTALMGTVFASAVAATDLATASPAAVGCGLRVTFALATLLLVVALALVKQGRARAPFSAE